MFIPYEDFDPLEATLEGNTAKNELLKIAKKREILNILKCYTGYFDIFSELIQNSLDATEKIWRINNNFEAKIVIHIDLHENSITLSDNGCGMKKEQFEFCLAPNISFKSNENLRGNKGVGATFLAYGFNNIKIHTKSEDFETSVILTDGRRWVENNSGDIERPKFRSLQNKINNFLCDEDHGSVFKITLIEGEKPKLTYLSANTAEQWLDILRIRTALGGINLVNNQRKQFRPSIEIIVTDSNCNNTKKLMIGAEYYYPHEIPNLKVESVTVINRAIESLNVGADERYHKLPDKYKKLNAVYEVWDFASILNDDSPLKLSTSLSEEQKELVEKHHVSVYGFFCNSTRIFDRFNDEILRVRRSFRILKGGLQLSTDGMSQGDMITVPLTKNIWYQNQVHVIVHFEQGEPDLGRKTFQPDKTELAVKLSLNVVTLLKKYRNHLKPDETSEPLIPDRDKHNWIREQENYFEKNPLVKTITTQNIAILSKPQKEQDVVALFNQLLGANIIKGIEIFATSEHNRYDALFRLKYKNDDAIYSHQTKLGISQDIISDFPLPYISEPKVLEYKYDFDALVRECMSGEKFHEHIHLVVAWNASLQYQGKVELKSLLINNRGRDIRQIYGSTHVAYLSGHYERPIYEVVILEDLLNYFADPENEELHQKYKYED